MSVLRHTKLSPGTKAGFVTGLQVFKRSRCYAAVTGMMKVIYIFLHNSVQYATSSKLITFFVLNIYEYFHLSKKYKVNV